MKIRLHWTLAGIPAGGEERVITLDQNALSMCELGAIIERYKDEVTPPLFVRGPGRLKLSAAIIVER